MTDADKEQVALVGALADVCRAKGIRVLELGRVKMQLGDVNTPGSTSDKADDDDKCKCGHPMHDHGPLCLHGCDVDKCARAA